MRAYDGPVPAHSDGWDELVRSFTEPAVRSLARRGMAEDQAREVVQDAWARIYDLHVRRGWPSIRLPALLIAVARNTWLDRCRHHARCPTDTLGEVQSLSDGTDFEAACASREILHVVSGHLDQLAARDRSVFLGSVEGRSCRDLASDFGIGRTRAAELVARIRARLRVVRDRSESPRYDHPGLLRGAA